MRCLEALEVGGVGPRARQRAGIWLLWISTQFACDSIVNAPAAVLAVLEHQPYHTSQHEMFPKRSIPGYDSARHFSAAPFVSREGGKIFPPPYRPILGQGPPPLPG